MAVPACPFHSIYVETLSFGALLSQAVSQILPRAAMQECAIIPSTMPAPRGQRTAVAMRRNAEPERRADLERVGRELAPLRDGR
jgi:hypothetical protein